MTENKNRTLKVAQVRPNASEIKTWAEFDEVAHIERQKVAYWREKYDEALARYEGWLYSTAYELRRQLGPRPINDVP
jgi:hypothetical protein